MSKAERPTKNQPALTSEAQAFRTHAIEAAKLMKALGNESRLLVLCALVAGERSVGELNTLIPLSQSALSQQLGRLRREGLVQTRRASQTIYYSLCPGPAHSIINLLHEIYCGTERDVAQDA